jgi:hypothetical protein
MARITKKLINSESATNGQVLTANGSGGTSWTTVSGGGGGGSLNTATVTVDFGTSDDMVTSTISAAWVTSTSIISMVITPHLTDHDLEDVLLEQLVCTYGNIVNGTSFDIFVHAPSDTWGRYIIKIMGA